MALYVNGNKVFNSLVVDGDLPEREVDKVYFQTAFVRGATPLTITLLETANKTSHIKLTGSVWAPSIPTGYTATTGTISDNSFTTTETSAYHWDYVQEFDITCGNDNAVIVYNGGLNNMSEVSLNVYHIYNLAPKTITQNGTYLAQDDNTDGYSKVEVDVPNSVLKPLVSTERFAQTSSYGGTDVSKAVQTFTIPKDGILIFGDGSYAVTNTSSNDGYVDIRINGVSVTKKYLSTSTNTSFTVPNITVSANDVLTVCVGFDNSHSNCWFNVFTAVTLCTTTPEYANLTSFAHYYKKNTTTPTITPISSNEVSLTFQDQNSSGYELCSFSVPLTKGLYVAEIYATLDKNTGLANRYTWGIYSCTSTSWASVNDNSPMDYSSVDTYVPFDKSDTNEHYYEVPIKVLADGTAYICFAMADDNGVNATVNVRSLKIRKAYEKGNGGGIDYLESWIINSKSAVNIPTTTTHLVYTNGEISAFENADNSGNETVTLGDISTFIGDASGFYWWVTANANMTYRIYNVLTGTLGELQTATSGTRIISDGTIDTNYCMEIRRYS